MTALLILFAAATWGALIYVIVVEPVRWHIRDKRADAERRKAMDERAASAALYPTTERRIFGQPATPFDLDPTNRPGGAATPRGTTTRR